MNDDDLPTGGGASFQYNRAAGEFNRQNRPQGALPPPVDNYGNQVAAGISGRIAATEAQRAALEQYERDKARYDYELLKYQGLHPVMRYLTAPPVAPTPPGGALGTQKGR